MSESIIQAVLFAIAIAIALWVVTGILVLALSLVFEGYALAKEYIDRRHLR